jgi:cysteine desulfurase family protein (TIGR01976 family)
LNNDWARAQFPSLTLRVSDQPVVYFDNPAGTQVPLPVVERMRDYFLHSNANSHGDFLTSRRTDEVIARARELGAAFLGARSAAEIAFGPNMTTLTYAVSRALARGWSSGDEVIVTDLDHDANISPWLDLSERGVVVRRIPLLGSSGMLDLQAFERLLSRKTRLVAVGYASNALGTINDVARIARLAHAVNASVWVDAVHYAPHGPIDVQALGADFLVCSAYKFFGPHLGLLWGKSERLDELRAHQVRPAPRTSPEKLETGTKNHEGLAGLVGALEYLAELGGAAEANLHTPAAARAALVRSMQAVRAYELELAAQLQEGLTRIPGLRLYGVARAEELAQRVPTFGFTLAGVEGSEVSRRLAEQGIFTWSGNHYALTLMERLGLAEQGGVVRVGAVHYNTPAEIERLLGALSAIAR